MTDLRNSILLLLFLLTTLVSYNAAAQWQDISSSRYDISFVKDKGIITGENGLILVSSDLGSTWNNLNYDLPGRYRIEHLYLSEDGQKIKIIANTHRTHDGWATEESLFRHSSDGGISWNTTHTAIHQGLLKFYFLNNEIGWLIKNETIFKTLDGGINWFEETQLTDFRNIHFYDHNNGWAVFINRAWPHKMKLKKTSDGGVTWLDTEVLSNSSSFGDKLFVLNANVAWIGTTGRELLQTSDGGKTWNRILYENENSIPVGGVEQIVFINELKGFIIADEKQTVYETSDGGKTWQIVLNAKPFQRFSKIYFIDQNKGFIIGSNGFTASTNDGGLNWQIDNFCPAGKNYGITSIQISENRTWVVTDDILNTSDSFLKEWETFHSPLNPDGFSDLDFSGNRAVLVGGGFWSLSDNLDKWEKSIPALKNRNQFSWQHPKVYLRNPDEIWISSYNNNLMKSIDGGKVFNNITPTTVSFNQFRLAFQTDSIIWTYNEGKIKSSHKSTDGGNTWIETTEKPLNIFFLSKSIGWKIVNKAIYKTVDGANSWQLQNKFSFIIGRNPILNFINENAGWLLDNSLIYKTIDGGKHWELDFTGYAYKLSQIKFHIYDDGTLIGLTGGQRLLKYMGPYVHSKSSQTIAFNPIPDKTFELNQQFTPDAFASSGLALTYESSNHEVATVSGNNIVIKGPGTTTITAFQEGTKLYERAEPVSHVLVVHKLSQKITFEPFPEVLFQQSLQLDLVATTTSGLAVEFESDNYEVATVEGNILNIHGVGTAIITALQKGDFFYEAAENQSQNLLVNNVTSIYNKEVNYENIFPNPAKDQVNIICTTCISGKEINVSLYNINGKKVHEYNILSKTIMSINIDNLSYGIYRISFLQDNVNHVFKFIKQK